MKYNLKDIQKSFKKTGVKDLRKAMTLLKLKTKGKTKQMMAGTILFKLCNDCRCKLMAEGIYSKDKPFDDSQLCEKCRPKWKKHIEKYKENE